MKLVLTQKMLEQINSDFDSFQHQGAITLATNDQGVWIVNEPKTKCAFLGQQKTPAPTAKPTPLKTKKLH